MDRDINTKQTNNVCVWEGRGLLYNMNVSNTAMFVNVIRRIGVKRKSDSEFPDCKTS